MSHMTAPSCAWQDQWNRPDHDALLDALSEQHHRCVTKLMKMIDGQDDLGREIVWQGPGWRWCWEYKRLDENGASLGTLCYIVPNQEVPLIAIPMSEHFIDSLPWRRLLKFIREGIRSAKCAVEVHWATWNLALDNECKALNEMVLRKSKYLAAQAANPGQ